ncbi:MAG: HAMP domain-containing protein [Magnetococcales bacterium]|nr:HAMP domain-containing protein [Magnetococcales bacterium]
MDRDESVRSQTIEDLSNQMWRMAGQIYELNSIIGRYILYREEIDQKRIIKYIPAIFSSIRTLEKDIEYSGQLISNALLVEDLEDNLNQYNQAVIELFQKSKEYGVTHQLGLQNEIRQIAHQMEIMMEPHVTIIVHLMQVRRMEKDFMLRQDRKYAARLNENLDELLGELQMSDLENRYQIEKLLNKYHYRFNQLYQLTYSINESIEKINNLWKDIETDLTALHTEARQIHDLEWIRYNQATNHLHYWLLLGILMIFMIMGSLLSAIFYGNILKPIRQLTQRAMDIAQGHYDWDISLSGKDEIGVLAKHLQLMKMALKDANHSLEIQVEQRTRQLSERNHELQYSLVQLQQTRDELVHSEKMASLGRLVAGFAHEINTPIGIGVGSISALPEYVQQLETLLMADEVNGDALDEIFSKIREMSQLCLSNLNTVAELVVRFKRISVDQSSELSRRFNLHEFLLDVTTSLHHLFKRSHIQLSITCPENVVIKGQPGALGQIFTNLLVNSLKHGFVDGTKSGTIQIEAGYDQTPTGHLLTICYTDDGVGMEPEVFRHAFDPFFTTARQSGGSGLGLYICYNIVRSQLNGRIVCSSIPGQMTSFLIEIPVEE